MDGPWELDPEAVGSDMRSRVIDLLRAAVPAGRLTLTDFEALVEQALAATTEDELGTLVREHAPPVRITPPRRRLPDVVEVTTSGMFANVKRTGDWQVPRRLEARTGSSWIILDFTDAVFDAWEVDVVAEVGSGDVVIDVLPGTAVQLVKTTGPVSSRIQPAVPGFPVIRLTAATGFGRIRLRHPKRHRRLSGR